MFQYFADSVFSDDFRCGFSGKHKNFLAVAVDVQLSRPYHGGELGVVLHGSPKRVVDAVVVEQLFLQVRAHFGGVKGEHDF